VAKATQSRLRRAQKWLNWRYLFFSIFYLYFLVCSSVTEAQMAAKQLATKIDARVKDALDSFCEERGLKIGRFIEDAILDKLEEYEDLSELRKLRGDSFRAFDEVLKDLKTSGKL